MSTSCLLMMLLLLWGGTLAHPAAKSKNTTGHIVGGVTVSIVDYPYQVSMRVNGEHICGASIISNFWLLSAAHCAQGISFAATTFKVGSTSRTIGGTILSPGVIVIHPNWNPVTLDFDIAVYKMKQAIVYSDKVGPITLATVNPPTGSFPIVSGWGLTTTETPVPPPDTLMAVSMPTISSTSCQSLYPFAVITPRMLCAGFTVGTKSACSGDSGGPLIVIVNKVKSQVGIVSWRGGFNCAAPNTPGVYTSVASLRGWIRTTTGV